ncbi:Stk1 family PASTA domain-containing Ser/Thr kinase [Streptomyces sp. SID5785]|uniref:Stk1 family PASTA domain-containing Ser/Thr kinase n=1 Tax=Streptomyces sp. SID5785 TaxID=2690309 RepID=UPI001361EDF4|nr:Stk1 family PASTA domain-containing Ser/Thr kinase [Streptomyces sp. SID5785]MZD03985.1 Stk1 family PASTA domain-containing Ser/Thr kinase [Streptomyces sp. SID5785]
MEEPRRLGGRYELGQVLGRGGMAEVYLAHDTRLGRTVAVKTLRADLARDPSFQARFRREAQSAASLNHPAIVAVYDTGEDYVDNISIPYIVMEYVDGSTLRELLHSGRKLLPERAMEMTIGILQALEYSHRAGIVHRDIKPANVMLTRTGQVKVMDFGIARAMGDSGMTMTQTAAVIGTAQYLSPEQAKGEQVDARSDLYSTGCLLYELLTVRPPFVGDSPVAVAYQHVREEAQPPSVFDPEITPEMDAIVLRALVKDPDYRYQSADEMRADIEACLDGQPVAATAAMGAVGYGNPDDQQTAMLHPQNGGAAPTSMLPPVNPDDGGYGYDDRPGRRKQGKKNHTSTILLVVAGLLVLVGAILIGKWVSSGGSDSGKVDVPSLVGETFADAQQKAENVDLKVVRGESMPCEDEPAKHVCEQDPKSGSVQKGDTITVRMSTGAPKVTVPDVQGLSYDEAVAQLEDKGFDNISKKTRESDRTEGKVIDQTPKGDSKVEKGTAITLTVAKKKETVVVPDVSSAKNLTCEQATATLEQNKLKASCSEEETDQAEAGKVFGQSLAANSEAEPGSTVTLKVAKEGEQLTVPGDIVGKKLKDAREQLSGMGLNVQLQPGSVDDPNATVAAANPGANSPVKKGDTITLITIAGGGGNQNGGGDGFIGGLGDR